MPYSSSGRLRPLPLKDVAVFKRCRLKYRNELFEEDLLRRQYITPEDIKKVRSYTRNYLCSLDDNIYGIEFEKLEITNAETGTTFFEINKKSLNPDYDNEGNEIQDEQYYEDTDSEEDQEDPNSQRFISYKLVPEFLQANYIGSLLQFKTGGDVPLVNFRMVERFFYRNSLLKSFDFNFGTINGSSRNCAHYGYSFISIPDEKRFEMYIHPFETRSDSFYFVDNRLVMHIKAEYCFDGDD